MEFQLPPAMIDRKAVLLVEFFNKTLDFLCDIIHTKKQQVLETSASIDPRKIVFVGYSNGLV
jgi:hypothetical protein